MQPGLTCETQKTFDVQEGCGYLKSLADRFPEMSYQT